MFSKNSVANVNTKMWIMKITNSDFSVKKSSDMKKMAQKSCEPQPEILHRYSEPWEKSDFILKVENEKLHVHKTVLELASPVISDILKSTRTSDELLIPNKKVKVVVLMLDLIYPAGPFIEGKSVKTTPDWKHFKIP